MIKVYFTAATSYDGELHEHYAKIVDYLKKNQLHIVSGLQIIDKKKLEEDKKLTRQEIYDRERKLIAESDIVVAEVSKPSLGVGTEIVYALTSNKPVLALVYQDLEDKISPMIAGNPSDNLFLEHYNLERLPYIIGNFVEHIKNVKKRKGSLIVIDGGNGSGKTTQTTMLVSYLKSRNFPVKRVVFPQYYTSFHGKTVARFLRGEFGNINEVSPYLASLAYAVDRASVKNEMEDFLKTGGYIIADRYATSSLAHQGAKFKDKKERQEFLEWLYELEYKVHKIPKENIVIYLYVPWKIGMRLVQKRGARSYLKGKTADIEEKDIDYWKAVEQMYLDLAKNNKHWVTVNCAGGGEILPPKEIHQKILQVLAKKNILL